MFAQYLQEKDMYNIYKKTTHFYKFCKNVGVNNEAFRVYAISVSESTLNNVFDFSRILCWKLDQRSRKPA